MLKKKNFDDYGPVVMLLLYVLNKLENVSCYRLQLDLNTRAGLSEANVVTLCKPHLMYRTLIIGLIITTISLKFNCRYIIPLL